MNLAQYQAETAASLLGPAHAALSPGLKLTIKVRNSWCVGRLAKGAYLTLSAIPPRLRDSFLQAWVDGGNGTNSFFNSEASEFLTFLIERLPNPSHLRSIAQFEQAVLWAYEGSYLPYAQAGEGVVMLARGSHATLVPFCGNPAQVLTAAKSGMELPPLSAEENWILCAPKIPSYCRPALQIEVQLWNAVIEPTPLQQLVSEHGRDVVENLVVEGVLNCCQR